MQSNCPPDQTKAWRLPAEQPCRPLVWIGLVASLLFTLRMIGPPNLLDQDQENPAAYVLDLVKNGNWICQRDLAGNICSKPPMYTWLVSLVTLATSRLTLLSLYLPGAAALFGTACLVFAFGKQHGNARAGWYAALACLFCPAGLKALGLARTDSVFAFMVTAGAFLAYDAWIQGRGWTWFWLAAAAGTLTKGPLALLLCSAGLLASFWERRSGDPRPLRGSQVTGVLCYLALTAGWFGLAVWDLGRPVVDKMIVQELVSHAAHGARNQLPGAQLYLSPLYYLARAAPWSLFGYYGLWRIYRTPASDSRERRFERFLFCWFVTGLFIFSLSPHQRGDLLWPIMPAAALIAGRELARLTASINPVRLNRLVWTVIALFIAGYAVYFLGPRSTHRMAQQTIAVRDLALQVEQHGHEFPLTHTDDPAGLQVFLNTYRPAVSFERAAALLRGPESAYVAVSDVRKLQSLRTGAEPPLYTLLETRGPVERLQMRIVANRPRLTLDASAALAVGPWLVRYQGRLLEASNTRLVFAAARQPGRVSVRNESQKSETLRFRFVAGRAEREEVRTIGAGETFTCTIEL